MENDLKGKENWFELASYRESSVVSQTVNNS